MVENKKSARGCGDVFLPLHPPHFQFSLIFLSPQGEEEGGLIACEEEEGGVRPPDSPESFYIPVIHFNWGERKTETCPD